MTNGFRFNLKPQTQDISLFQVWIILQSKTNKNPKNFFKERNRLFLPILATLLMYTDFGSFTQPSVKKLYSSVQIITLNFLRIIGDTHISLLSGINLESTFINLIERH